MNGNKNHPRYKHGMSDGKAHRKWMSMRERCYSKTNYQYFRYGGRGIKVCDRWQVFINFYADMGECPEGMTLDRIDVNGDYSPENCRWATMKEQCRNRRTNKLITFKGQTKPLAMWAEELGIKQTTLQMRLSKYKWPIERALSKADGRKRRVENWLDDCVGE